MPADLREPLAHVRIIGPAELVGGLAATIRTQLGPAITCTTSTHTARRAGHIRLYLIARKAHT